jgi:hypothetical protein
MTLDSARPGPAGTSSDTELHTGMLHTAFEGAPFNRVAPAHRLLKRRERHHAPGTRERERERERPLNLVAPAHSLLHTASTACHTACCLDCVLPASAQPDRGTNVGSPTHLSDPTLGPPGDDDAPRTCLFTYKAAMPSYSRAAVLTCKAAVRV